MKEFSLTKTYMYISLIITLIHFVIKKTYAYYFFSIWGFIYDFNKNTEILVKRHKFYFISNLKSHTLNKISFTSINVDNILTI